MAAITGTIALTGLVTPKDTEDKYAVYDSQYMKGGWHEVDTLADRDAISEQRRSVGMACYVTSESALYVLAGGIDNTNWLLFESGEGTTTLNVPTLADRDAIPEEDRVEGMAVVVYNDPSLSRPTTYYLIGGITNEYWVEQEIPEIDPNTVIWTGPWSPEVTYKKGQLVTAPSKDYYASTGAVSRVVSLVCTVANSTPGVNSYPPLTEFAIVGMFDLSNRDLTISDSTGIVYPTLENEETADFQPGNIVLVPDYGLLLCVATIASKDPSDEAEKDAWIKLVDTAGFESSVTDVLAKIETIETDLGTVKTDLTALETSVTELSTKVDGIEDDVTALTSTVDAHTTKLGEHDTAIQENTDGIAAINEKLPYLQNDYIALETLAERDALAAVEGLTLVRGGVTVLVYGDPSLENPTAFMWDSENELWIEQVKIDPDTAVWSGEWNAESTYKKGAMVVKSNVFYIAESENTDADPSDEGNAAIWKMMSGSTADFVFNRDEGVYSAVGGVTAGMNLKGMSASEIFETMFFPYQAPSFGTFEVSSQATSIEVGDTIVANKTFNFSVNNSSNVDGVYTIFDTTNGNTAIASNVTSSPAVSTSSAVTLTAPGSQVYTISGQNSKGATFTKTATIAFKWMLYYGESEEASLDNAGALDLRIKSLATTAVGTYNFNSGGYKYLLVPSTFPQPTGFKDDATGLGVAIMPAEDLLVTNSKGVELLYKVYRTVNVLNTPLKLIVTL